MSPDPDWPEHAPRGTVRRPGALPVVDERRCTGCGRCVGACAPHVLSLQATGWIKHAVLGDAQGCTGCSRCAVVCPFRAIAMRRPQVR